MPRDLPAAPRGACHLWGPGWWGLCRQDRASPLRQTENGTPPTAGGLPQHHPRPGPPAPTLPGQPHQPGSTEQRSLHPRHRLAGHLHRLRPHMPLAL